MRQQAIWIISFSFIILSFLQPAWSHEKIKSSITDSLTEHEFLWPKWFLPGPFKKNPLEQNLFYPEYFEGSWEVQSFDMNDLKNEPIIHIAHFQLDDFDRVVADRAFNSKSLGKKIYGSNLIDVKDDPNSFNRQLSIFTGNSFLETKVIGRIQSEVNDSTFLVDELLLQIFHSPGIPRISKVETLSKYSQCNNFKISSFTFIGSFICGEQWQAIYDASIQRLYSLPNKTNHFKLILRPI